MKKLFFMLLVGSLIYSTGCRKEIQTQTPSQDSFNYTVKSPYDENLKFDGLNVNIKIDDGVLTFQTQEDLAKVIAFLRRAKSDEIEKWENSLIGFTSVYKNYFDAKDELDENPENFKQIKVKYQNKVDFAADYSLKPIIENGLAFGRIIGEKHFYVVGGVIVLYHNEDVISITDGDFNKIELAKRTLKTDVKANIYVHSLFPKKDALKINTLNPRVATRLCINSCPEKVGTFTEQANNRRLVMTNTLINNTTYTGHAIFPNYSVNCKVKHEKKALIGWKDDNTGFNWGFGWEISVKSSYGIIYPENISAGGYTWDVNSSFLNADVPIAGGIGRGDLSVNDFFETIESDRKSVV